MPRSLKISARSATVAFSHTLESRLLLAHGLVMMMCRKIEATIFTDSQSLFRIITNLSSLCEKCIIKDVSAIREGYNTGKLTNVTHVLSRCNLEEFF